MMSFLTVNSTLFDREHSSFSLSVVSIIFVTVAVGGGRDAIAPPGALCTGQHFGLNFPKNSRVTTCWL